MKFSAACPTIQAANSIGILVAKEAHIIVNMKTKAPPTIHGVRFPKRDRVLSESAPATMLEMAATIIPQVEKRATS